MPRSHNPALEQAKSGLDSVGCDVAFDVNSARMVDSLVFAEDASLRQRRRIRTEVVRHNHVHVFAHVFIDVLRQRSRLHIGSMEEPEFSAALLDPDNHFLALERPAPAPLAVLFSAHVGFVNLKRTSQPFRLSRLHRSPNTVAEIPCCLVAPADHAAHLVRADALAGLAHQVGGSKPRWKGKFSILQHCPGQNGELIAA